MGALVVPSRRDIENSYSPLLGGENDYFDICLTATNKTALYGFVFFSIGIVTCAISSAIEGPQESERYVAAGMLSACTGGLKIVTICCKNRGIKAISDLGAFFFAGAISGLSNGIIKNDFRKCLPGVYVGVGMGIVVTTIALFTYRWRHSGRQERY